MVLPTQRMNKAARRAQLVEMATEFFGVYGLHETSMEDIANAAGVTKPVIYQHFDSKDELYLAVVDSIADRIIPVLQDLAQATGESPERVRVCIQAVFDMATQPGNLFKLFFSSDANALNRETSDRVHEVITRCNTQVTTTLAQYRDLTEDDAAVIAEAMSAVAQSAAVMLPNEADEEMKNHYIDLVTAFLVSGISAFPAKKYF